MTAARPARTSLSTAPAERGIGRDGRQTSAAGRPKDDHPLLGGIDAWIAAGLPLDCLPSHHWKQ